MVLQKIFQYAKKKKNSNVSKNHGCLRAEGANVSFNPKISLSLIPVGGAVVICGGSGSSPFFTACGQNLVKTKREYKMQLYVSQFIMKVTHKSIFWRKKTAFI